MSIKKNAKYLIIMLSLFTFFIFGCKDSKVDVTNVSINLGEQTQVSLLVDEFFDFSNKVDVSPNYATDKSYSVYSLDEDIVRVVGKQIKAVKEGETMVRVVSNSNQNVEDVVTVKVYSTQTKLETPTNLRYDEQTQSFGFNPVDYAHSYSININEREFNIGNSTTFNLSKYVGEKFNNVLNVKVKANAPTYTHAYCESDYSASIKVFQTASVDDVNVKNGVLSYSSTEGIVFDVYFNNIKYAENTILNSFDLTNLDSAYAGTNIAVYVVAKPSETVCNSIGRDVSVYSSLSNQIVVNVIDEPEISICDSVISWEDVAFVTEYQVFVNGESKATVSKNSFNLKDLEIYNNIKALESVEISVKSVFKNGTNLAKTNKISTPISVVRLSTPEAELTGNLVAWQEVENASVYSVEVVKDDTKILSINTNKTSLDMTNFKVGNYTVKIMAVGSNVNANYLTSKPAVVSVVKEPAVTASVTNYVLNVNAKLDFRYAISFVIDSNNTYSQTLTANSNKIELDLSAYSFSTGNHQISITELGDNNSYIDSETKFLSFTQLEKTSVNIANSTASVTRSEINKNANIYLEISGDNLESPIKVNEDSYLINTINATGTYLTAGDYSVVAYVEGNGSSTFSYGGKTPTKCGEFNFKVLNVPSLQVTNSAVAKISVNQVDNATNYTILDENNLTVSDVNDSYSFALLSGERKQFKVRANGNGTNILSSLSSDVLTVERLVTPELIFVADNLSFKVETNNLEANYQKVNFYFEDLQNEEYQFNTAFTGLSVGENKFKINLKSSGEVEGVEYLDSLFNEIIVKKLSNQFSANIDNENKLNISNSENAQLMLSFDFDTNEYLAQNGTVSDLNYVTSGSNYIITLLDNDYKAIKPAMASGFKVKVKYAKQTVENSNVKVYYTNSDWSEFTSLKLNALSSVNSIYSDTNNKLIVENPNSQKLYLDLYVKVGSNWLTFKDNGRNQLVCGDTVLTYTYNGKYYIDLYKDEVINIAGISSGNEFEVKVQLKKTLAGSAVDAELSSAVTVKYLQDVKFVRDNQNLSFVTIGNDYGLDKYKLVVNDKNSYSLNDFASVFTQDSSSGLTKYTTPILDLLNAINVKTSLNLTDVNSIKLVTLNSLTTKENVLLGSTGNNIYLQQAQSFSVTSKKESGQTILNVEKFVTDYSKTYCITLKDEKTYIDDGNNISEILDNIEFSGELPVYGYIKANSSYSKDGKQIYVFNSSKSNTLTFTKLNTPVLSVADNKISYTSVENATEYEVYQLETGGVKEIVDNTILNREGNSFMFNNLGETAEFKVLVKAVTNSTTILNSDYSETVCVVKLGESNFYIDSNGSVKLKLPSGTVNLIQNNVNARLVLKLNGKQHICSLSGESVESTIVGISWDSSRNDEFYVSSSLIFNYSDSFIKDKNVSVTLQLSGKYNDKYYIYTNEYTNQVKGLFAPTYVGILKSKEGNVAENLTYTNNSKNKLSIDGELISFDQYVFKFVHNNKTYHSTDPNLKYKTDSGFASFGTITSTTIPVPYGYDKNNDGDFDDDGDVIFNYGSFKVSVACYTSGYATSPYSSEFEFEILAQLNVSLSSGKLTWNSVSGAEKYFVTINEFDTTNMKVEGRVHKATLTDTSYDFEDFEGTGVYSVTVQALSDNNHKLNSEETAGLIIYRLPVAKEIKISNGILVVKASKYAESIKVTLNNKSQTYANTEQRTNLKALDISNYQTFLDAENEENYKYYYIDLTKTEERFNGATNQNIKIQIMGNTGTQGVLGKNVGIISSRTIDDEENATVLGINTNINTKEVEKGKWTFTQNSNLGTDIKTQINYKFNDDAFWLDTIIYQIEINKYSNGVTSNNVIYAVDYYRFIDAKDNWCENNSCSSFDECTNKNGLYARITCQIGDDKFLYFNVYKDNVIDLQSYDTLNYYDVKYNIETNSYISESADIKTIDLAGGGTFNVRIRIIGGCDKDNNALLNSCVKNVGTFVRFGQANLTTQAGMLAFNSLTLNDNVPVYKLTITKSGSTQYVYLYDKNAYSAEDIKTYFNLDDSVILEPISTDGNNIIYDMSKHFGYGNYSVYVRALASETNNDYLLNAKEPTNAYAVSVFSSITPTISDGNITFTLADVVVSGAPQYSKNYEIAVEYDGQTYSTQISDKDENVVINGTKLTYTLPDKIGNLDINSGKEYALKIRALTNDVGRINAKFNTGVSFTRKTTVDNVEISNGILHWTGGASSDKYLIKLSYTDNNTSKSIVISERYNSTKDGKYTYEFKDSDYPVYNTSYLDLIKPNIAYTISVCRVGDSDTISSKYIPVENVVYRLDSVKESEIKANSGLLTWTEIEDAVGYEIEFVGSSGSNKYTVASNSNQLDLTSTSDDNGNYLSSGSYTVKIKAKGNNKINSTVTTSANTITKLEKVTNITFAGDTISWNAVDNATGYLVKFEYTNTSNIQQEKTQTVNINSIASPTDIQGKLTVTIMALGDNLTMLNSDYVTSETSNETPNGIVNLEYNKDLLRFEWNTQSDFTSSDKIIIKYNFTEYSVNGNIVQTQIKQTIIYQQSEYYDNGKYFYPLTVMGKYSGVTIIVSRQGTINSAETTYNMVDLQLFKYGAGTSDNPYVLDSEHFTNIKYYPNATYQLIENITLTGVTSTVIDCEFTGTINGNNMTINLGEISLTDATEFALFKSINGGTITNLSLQANITNSIAQINGDVKLAILAVTANNAKLNNVIINASTITISNENDYSGNVYVGGMLATDIGSSLENCLIALKITNNVKGNKCISYIAGAVAYGEETDVNFENSITSKNSYITLTASGGGYFNYLGGVFGYYIGKTGQSKGVKNATVELNFGNKKEYINMLYAGGVFGYAKYAIANDNTITGTMIHNNIVSDIFVGGLAGTFRDGKASGNTVNATMEFTVQTMSGTQRLGKIVGSLETDDDASCSLSGNYPDLEAKIDLTTGTTLTLGVYGYKDTSVNTDGLITKDSN